MNFLNNTPIKTKIWGSFLALLALLVLIAVVANLRFSGLRNDIAGYQAIAADAAKVAAIKSQTLSAQVLVQEFLSRPTAETAASVQAAASAARTDIRSVAASATDANWKATLGALDDSLAAYAAAFGEVAALQIRMSETAQGENERIAFDIERKLTRKPPAKATPTRRSASRRPCAACCWRGSISPSTWTASATPTPNASPARSRRCPAN